MRGRRIALSPPRRLLTDLSHLSRAFPRATLLTRINVAALTEPRDQARIPWPVVFAKAYALVAAGSPPLRRVYVKLPWPHLYELPQSVASIIVERDWPHDGDSDEKALFLGRLKAPDTATLPDLATRLLALKTAPIDSIADFRRALAIARLPLPLRLLLVWLSLNIGRQVPNFMGSIRISGAVTPRPAQRQHRCRWQGRDTSVRIEAAAYHRGRVFVSAIAGAPRVGSIASAGAWQSVC
jgi:hypothetical protein